LPYVEELSNAGVAKALALSKTATSKRYIRAFKRLSDALGGVEGVLDI
jgi:DNA-directed RNA polymerase specialized sigma24 family protein